MANKNQKKNHFNVDSAFLQETFNDIILSDKVDKILRQKFAFLIQVYLNKASQSGYNPSLAFRIIVLYLYCQFKNNEQETIKFNLINEVQRYITYQLSRRDLQSIRKCMDLLLVKQLNMKVPEKYVSFWRIRILQQLKNYYSAQHLKKDRKKASLTLRQLCKQQLKKEYIKHEVQIYAKILDILLDEQRLILNSKISHGKSFEAIQNANNIIKILEKSEHILIARFQQKLMLAYWDSAQLHYKLHYITYAKKYCEATINISQRINDKKVNSSAKNMLEDLKNQ